MAVGLLVIAVVISTASVSGIPIRSGRRHLTPVDLDCAPPDASRPAGSILVRHPWHAT